MIARARPVLPGLILFLVAAALPLVLRGSFQQNVMALMAAYAIAALGLNLLVGVAGQISLGHGAFMSIGGYTTAILTLKAGLPAWVGVLGAALVTAAIGFLLGLPALRLRGHFLALATLSFGTAIPQIATKWDPVTGGATGLLLTREKFPSDAVAYWAILAVLGGLAWVAHNLLGSRPGRALHAVRESEVAAQAMGVNLAITKTGIFALSALYAGVAGALATHLSGYISPSAFGLVVSFTLLASIVVGGLGSIGGAILGAAVVAWLPFLASRTSGLASVVEGGAIIAIVLLLPRGLVGVWSRLGQPRFGLARPAGPEPVAAGAAAEVVADARRTTHDARPLLEIEHLSVSFGGVHALQDVSFSVAQGSIHGLIGPNGAGKTTALNCISRFIDPSQGSIRFDGQDLLSVGPSAVAGLGISRTFQGLALCHGLSALDNVLLGFYHRVRAPAAAFALSLPVASRAEASVRAEAHRLLAMLEADHVATSPVQSLPYGLQKRVELARALACGGRLLILDEPAAGLDAGERAALVEVIRRLRDQGQTILLVEHDMGMVMTVCDRVSVLDFGRLIADGSPEAAQADPAVVAAYLGEEAGQAQAETRPVHA